MKLRLIPLILIVSVFLSFGSCSGVVGDIAGNVRDAALKELEAQIQKTVEEYKVEVVEVKSAVGRLNNGSDSRMQFFCGVLVRSNSDALPKGGAEALDGLFEQSGIQKQTGSQIENPLLVNKKVSFKHSDFSSGDYYMIWVYSPSLTQKLQELELPTLPADWQPAGEAQSVG